MIKFASGQFGRLSKSAVLMANMIDEVAVRNILASFFCVLGKYIFLFLPVFDSAFITILLFFYLRENAGGVVCTATVKQSTQIASKVLLCCQNLFFWLFSFYLEIWLKIRAACQEHQTEKCLSLGHSIMTRVGFEPKSCQLQALFKRRT